MPDKFIWNLQYSVHSEEIDAQHKRFFELINAIYDLLEQEIIDPEKFLILVTHLGDYAFYHFATEEGYFQIFGYQDAAGHIKEHDEFRKQAKEFIERVRQEKGSHHRLAAEVADFAKEWLTKHILIEDQKYMPLFRTHGVS